MIVYTPVPVSASGGASGLLLNQHLIAILALRRQSRFRGFISPRFCVSAGEGILDRAG